MHQAISERLQELRRQPTWESGQQLFREGAVLDVQLEGKTVEVRVANACGRFERVDFNFRRTPFGIRCTCGGRGMVCDHAIASLLHMADQQGVDADLLSAGPAPAAEPVAAATRLPDLRELIDNSGKTPARLRICLFNEAHSLETRWERLDLEVSFIQDDKVYSISNLRRLVENGTGSGGMRFTDFSLQARNIMRFVLAYGEIDPPLVRLGSHEMADLLHLLSGFDGFYRGQARLGVFPEQATLQLLLEIGNDQQQRITPRINLPGHGPLPPAHITGIFGRGGCWIGLGNGFWWLPAVAEPNWLRTFIKGDSISVDADELAAFARISALDMLPVRLMPGETADSSTLSVAKVKCQPVLLLHWHEQRIDAHLHFDYGGMRIAFDAPQVIWRRHRFINRDADAEQQSVQVLRAYGFTLSTGGMQPGNFRLRDADKVWYFLHRAIALLEKSWQLYMSPQFQAQRQSSGSIGLQVQTYREDKQWFELQYSLRTPLGTIVELSELPPDDQPAWSSSGELLHVSAELRRMLDFLQSRSSLRRNNVLRFDSIAALSVGDLVRDYCRDSTPAQWQQLRGQLLSRGDLPVLQLPASLRQSLRSYQHDGVAWMALLQEKGFHGILADEMGLGKTVQALAAIVHRCRTRSRQRPSLIICPTSLVDNWRAEARRFAPELQTLAISGSQRSELIAQLPQIDLAITSYALLRRDIDVYQLYEYDYLILDEAQHIKNPDTVNARTCKTIAACNRLVLTGTPLENRLRDIWSLFDFLLPGYLGSQQHFQTFYGDAEAQCCTAELAAHIRPFVLRRTKREVCEQLPPKLEQVVYCELTADQQHLYRQLQLAAQQACRQARDQGWNQNRFEILTLLLRLRQVCCHPQLLPPELQGNYDAANGEISAKTELLRELILQAIDSGHRILLFSQFTAFFDLFRPWLQSSNIAYEYLDGSTKDRQQRVDRFNGDASIPLFLLSLRAGGTGLNLTGADMVIHYDQWWNPMVEAQATDRTHRIGQQRQVTALKLVARNTIEERILDLQEHKRMLFDDLMSGIPNKVVELTPDDVAFLLEDEVLAQDQQACQL